MKQSHTELNRFRSQALKWSFRSAFMVIFMVVAYVATRQAYNFSHWVPHNFLREIGVPYQAVLWGEQNADLFLHFFIGTILTFLIFGAKLSFFDSRPSRIFSFVCLLCLGAEIFQFAIGRGLESSDLLLGILGSFMAYSTINKKNQTSPESLSHK